MNSKYVKSGRTNQKLATRKKILSGAKYFIDKGETFTLEDVAKKVEISRATVYRYYSNLDVLTSEAALYTPKDYKSIYNDLCHLQTNEVLLGIQEYYNNFTIENENAFRKYLSVVISTKDRENKRGARRNKTIQLALKNQNIPQKDKDKIANFVTILMGIEPIIVSKDVCRLDNDQSKDLLKWGLEMVLKGIAIGQNP
jgi:hypothetical protein